MRSKYSKTPVILSSDLEIIIYLFWISDAKEFSIEKSQNVVVFLLLG